MTKLTTAEKRIVVAIVLKKCVLKRVDISITHMDTTEVGNIANDILTLTNEYDDTIDRLFKRLENVPEVTREWVGGQAKIYFGKIATEKSQFMNLSRQLKDIAHKLQKDSFAMQNCITKNHNEEIRR